MRGLPIILRGSPHPETPARRHCQTLEVQETIKCNAALMHKALKDQIQKNWLKNVGIKNVGIKNVS